MTIREYPLHTGGNVYFNGARAYVKETKRAQPAEVDPKPEMVEEGDRVYLRLSLAREAAEGRDQARDHRAVGEGEDSGAGLRERRRLAGGHRRRLFRQETKCGHTLAWTFRKP